MKQWSFLCIALLMASCGKNKPVRIQGELNGANADTLFIRQLTNQPSPTDTVVLDAEGRFSVKLNIDRPTFCAVTANRKTVTLLAYPGDRLNLTGDVRHLPLTYRVEGNEDAQYIQQLTVRMEMANLVRDSLNRKLAEFAGNRNFVNIRKQFEWDYIREIDSLRAYNIRFINRHPESLAVIYSLYQNIDTNVPLFNSTEDLEHFQRADSTFFKRYPNVWWVQSLHNNTMEMIRQHNAERMNRMFSVLGQPAHDIEMNDPTGKPQKLSSLKGRPVLLNFWASWNPASRAENKDLVKMYRMFHSQGLEIFQVSLDKTEEAWQQAIREDSLTWINVCNFKYWDTQAAKEYIVENLPATFLIDADWTVSSKGLSGNDLEQRLRAVFATPK